MGPVVAVTRTVCATGAARRQSGRREPVLEHENGALSTLNASYASASEYYLMNIYGKDATRFLRPAQGFAAAQARREQGRGRARHAATTLSWRSLRNSPPPCRGNGSARDGRRLCHPLACGRARRNPLGARRPPVEVAEILAERLSEGHAMKRTVFGLRPICACADRRLGMREQPPQKAPPNPFAHKPTIEITVLFPAGSSADITARLLADGIAKQLGTNVIVVNRPGAGGAIGYRHVAGRSRTAPRWCGIRTRSRPPSIPAR